MKLLIKPLKGGEFELDNVQLTDTVGKIKERIEAEKGAETFQKELQKLIHASKIMSDEKTLADYGVKEEGSFLVCMVSRKKKKGNTSAAATTSSAAATSSAPPSSSTPSNSTPPAATTPAPAPAVTPPAAATGAGAAAAPAGGVPVSQDSVNHLTEMGFAESDARAALQAAFGNAERAVEFLTNPGLMQAAQAAQAQAGGAGGAAPAAGAGAGGNPLQRFREDPMFNTLRRAVQENPGTLEQILAAIGQRDPALFNAINENMEEFVNMMNEPVPDDAPTLPMPGAGAGAGAGGLPGMGGDGMPQLGPQQLQQMLQAMQQMTPEQRTEIARTMGLNEQQLDMITRTMQNMSPEQLQQMMAMSAGAMGGMGGMPGMGGAAPENRIRLSPEEVAAIDRLAELGFPRHACLEAYLACDKNEELAANYLFMNPPEDDQAANNN